MSRICLVVLVLFVLLVSSKYTEGSLGPEQVHLSYSADPTQLVVTWVTLDKTISSKVEYGVGSFDQSASAVQTEFVDGGPEKRKIYIHRARLTDLKPEARYNYHCGYPGNWSKTFSFKVMKEDTNWTARFAILGDMGTTNDRSLKWLISDVAQDMYDAVIHVGDFGYDLDSDNGRRGDLFMNQVEPITAFLPYMTLPGNHEMQYNFSHYKNRYTMPGGDGQGQYYSFNVGPAHFVFFSTEFYYYLEYGFQQVVNQYKWLEQDLKEANKPENRSKRPWIFAMGHRPFYCSSSDDPTHCPNIENMVRVGIPYIHTWGLEELLYKYNVDLVVTAHEHNYERMFPVYNLTVCNGSVSEPYTNPRAPVHIVEGSAGCDEHLDPFVPHPNPYSAFHASDYGYSRMTYNHTHIFWEQISDQNGTAIDKMTMIKTKQQPFDCHVRNV